MTYADKRLKPFLTADFDAETDFGWYEELGRLVTRTNIIGEVKSDAAWKFYEQSGDSDFRKRLEKGISQARLIIVDPTVVQSAKMERYNPADENDQQITNYSVLRDLLAYFSPLYDLKNKEVILPNGVGISTDHLGRFGCGSDALDAGRIVLNVGRRSKHPSKIQICEANVLRFIAQFTSAHIDIVNPQLWHAVNEESETVRRAEQYERYTKLNIRNLTLNISRGSWHDDDIQGAMWDVTDAILHDVNNINRLFNPRACVPKNLLGKFDDYSTDDGHWRYASDIAAGFARKWFEEHLAANSVLKAKSLARKFCFVVYNNNIISCD